MKRFKGDNLWISGMIALLFILGSLFTWWLACRADRSMRADLLQQTSLVAQSVNLKHLQTLTGTKADLDLPDYLQLKEQLARIKKANSNCRFIYLLGRKPDGAVFFFVDNEPIGSEEEAPAGMIYDDVPDGFRRIFETRQADTEGPYTDQWGAFVSGAVPLFDPKTGELIAVLCMDMDADNWNWDVAVASALPIGLMLILLIVVVSWIIVIRPVKTDVSVKPVLRRLMIPLTMVLLLLVGGFIAIMIMGERKDLNKSSQERMEAVSYEFKKELATQTKELAILEDGFLREVNLIDALKAQDREHLLADYEPVFKQLRDEFGVTHFYFQRPDRVNLLRVHKPEKSGDLINRFTTLEAERTKQTASGIELGPLGTFTLRVVKPVFDGETLIGYFELGKEIEDVLAEISAEHGVDLMATIQKSVLSRQQWESGMQMLGRDADWERFPDDVIIYSSLDGFPDEAGRFVGEEGHIHEDVTAEANIAGKLCRVINEPLCDASGAEVGDLIIMHNISRELAAFSQLIFMLSVAVLVILGGLLAFLFILLRRVDVGIRAQQADLQASEEQYRSTLNELPVGVVVHARDTSILLSNPEATNILGLTFEQMAGKRTIDPAWNFVYEDLAIMKVQDYPASKVFSTKKPLHDYLVGVKRPGRDYITWVLVNAIPTLSNDGEVEQVIVNYHDITERKQAEASLRESESLQRTLLQNINAGVVIIDAATHVIEQVNQKGVELFGNAEEQVVGHVCHCFLCPAEQGCCPVSLEGGDVNNSDRILVRADGSHLPILKSVRHIQIKGKDKLLETFIDISDRKAVEDKLKESETNFRVFFNSIDDFLFVLDEQGNMLHVNETVAHRLKYSTNELIGRNVLMVHPEDQRAEAGRIVSQMIAGTADFCPVPLITKSGEFIQVETRVYPGSWNGQPALFGVTKDITRVKAQQAEMQKLLSAIDQSPSTIVITDADGNIEYVNPAFTATTGYTAEEAMGQNPRVLKSGEMSPENYADLWHTICAGKVWRGEFHNKKKNGELYWESALISPVLVESGAITHFIAVKEDITERKQMEVSLQEKQSRLDLALESAQMGAWHWDIIENKRYFDAKVCQLLGIDPDRFNGTAEEFLGTVHPDDLEPLKEALTSTIEEDVPYEPVYRAVWPDGSIHHISAHGKLVRDDTGRPARIIGLIGDITKAKETAKVLQETTDRLSLATKAGGVGVWDYDNVDNVLSWDDQMFRLYGITKEQFSRDYEAWHARVHPEDQQRWHEEIQLALRGEKEFDTEFRVLWPDGSVHSIRALAKVERDASGKPLHMIGTNWDITAHKKSENELLEVNKQLELATSRANSMAAEAEMANVAKSEFLANMSHEIRTPMNGVVGMTGLLLDTELTDDQRRYADIVRESGQSLLSLINDILDFSKIEAGKLDLEILDFDLQRLLDDFAATLAVQAHEKGLELFCGMSTDVPELLRGDPGRLRQILTNLTGNAIKFTEAGEVTVGVTVEYSSEGAVMLRFSVRDTGIGIPGDKMGLLFDEFTQVDAATTRKFGGTGLGLAISKQLAELMGGDVGVTSKEGVGSEFWFTARLEKQSDAMSTEKALPADLDSVRVLIVDDNATSREILNTRMSSWGMRVSETIGGEEALVALYSALDENDPFRVAVIDMQMPGMDGAGLGCAIRADACLAEIRMVLLSSLGLAGDTNCFAEIGFSACLSKPVRILDLKAVLSQVLSTREGDASQPHHISTPRAPGEILNPLAGCKARILLAEDNLTNQQVALGILKKFGLTADAVANGAEAVKALESVPYDLVLMDVQMPKMDGYEATARIRDPHSRVQNHDVPIIAMTAHAMAGDREKCLEAGMSDYIAKPVDPNALAVALEKWLPKKLEDRGQRTEDRGQPASLSATPSQGQSDDSSSGSTGGDGVICNEPAKKAKEEDASELPVWDKEAMLERLMGDEDLGKTIMEGFLGDIPKQIANLKQYLKNSDMPGVERQAHTIKGASANVGGEVLRALAFKMEKAGKAGDMDAVKADMQKLEKCFDRLKEEADRHLG